MTMYIYGKSLDKLTQNHRDYLGSLFVKPKTVSRLKELQSAIIFFNQYSNDPEIGKLWRNKYAKRVNISCIVAVLKAIEPLTHIHIHRICKTSYPLYVFISKHYEVLKPYLETFISVETKNYADGIVCTDNPFKRATEHVKRNGYNNHTVIEACYLVAKDLSSSRNEVVESVTAVQSPNGDPIFVAIINPHY